MRRILYIILTLLLIIGCEPKPKPTLSVAPQRASFTFEGGLGQVIVTSSEKWDATSDAEWVTIDSTNATTVFYQLAPNVTSRARYANITISIADIIQRILIEQAPSGDQPLRKLDSLALADLFDQCDGSNWYLGHDTTPHPWVLARPIDQWDGVTTNIIDGQLRVISLNLSGVGVSGTLPSSMRNLSQLQVLMLRQNPIEGDAISICAQLPELLYLDLARNFMIDFSNTPRIGSFGKLQFLDISVCNIGGVMPKWALQPTLTELLAAGCAITGEIPSEMASMSNLSQLDLSDNQLSGEIPQWITTLRQLTHIDLSTCNLSGRIPTDIGDLSSLQVLKLANNNLTGEIPSSISRMSNLYTLNLSQNKLTNLPDQIIERCTKLKSVNLSFNNIEGGLTASWAALKGLETLTVMGNRLSGTIPEVLLSDPRWNKIWFAKSLIIPQQEGYGFNN